MPNRPTAFVFACLTLAAASGAQAREKPPELAGAVEATRAVGAADFRVLFWPVFRATLWSGDGAFDWAAPFALSLTYARTFTADQLTDKTVEEMARLTGRGANEFTAFGREFGACIDDVGPGDRITAISVDDEKARLFLNGRQKCTLERPALRREFFGIWLSRDSLFPEATERLIGSGE